MKRSKAFEFVVCAMLSYLVFLPAMRPPLEAQTPAATQAGAASGLTIKILEGEDGVNIIQRKTAVKPVVQVVDRNDLPVAGAAVLFVLPGSGPSATFAGGSRTLTVVTNATGRASTTSMTPSGTGTFDIIVTATYQGQVAMASIAQTNYLTVAAAQAAGVPSTAISAGAGVGGGLSTAAIVGIVAGAAAVATGVAVAKTRGQTPSGTIGVGGVPTLGPPR